MNLVELPTEPTARPITRTSPTLDEALRECTLKVAFKDDYRFSKIGLLSTSQRLGIVSHALLEESTNGRYDQVPEPNLGNLIHEHWDELIDIEYRALQKQAIANVPPPVRWPQYALKRAAACIASTKIAKNRISGWDDSNQPGTGAVETHAEKWYEGFGGKLGGKIDVIRQTEEGIEVVDYKSGPVIEKDENLTGNRVIKDNYRRQMLIYSALINEVEGQYPIKATLHSLVDGPQDVLVDPRMATTVVSEALGSLDDYNIRVKDGTITGNPGETTCEWCDFKPACKDYMQAADESWHKFNVTITGVLTEVEPRTPPQISMDITGGNHEKGQCTIRQVPSELTNNLVDIQDSTLSFTGLKRDRDTGDLLFTWNSQCWRLG